MYYIVHRIQRYIQKIFDWTPMHQNKLVDVRSWEYCSESCMAQKQLINISKNLVYFLVQRKFLKLKMHRAYVVGLVSSRLSQGDKNLNFC